MVGDFWSSHDLLGTRTGSGEVWVFRVGGVSGAQKLFRESGFCFILFAARDLGNLPAKPVAKTNGLGLGVVSFRLGFGSLQA